MAAVARKESTTGLDRLQQMKRTNGAARAERLIAVARNHYRRTVVALNDPRRGDADAAAGPAFSIAHNAIARAAHGFVGEPLFHLAQDSPFFLLALGVETIEFGG